MYSQVEKTKENNCRAVANSVIQKKSGGGQKGLGVKDNRREATRQKKLQLMVDRQITNKQFLNKAPIQLVHKLKPAANKENELVTLIKEAEEKIRPWLQEASYEGAIYSVKASIFLGNFNSGVTYYKQQLQDPTESDDTLRLTISMLINKTIELLNTEIDKAINEDTQVKTGVVDYKSIFTLKNGTLVNFPALIAVMSGVEIGISVPSKTWRKMRADLSAAITLSNKSHPAHGSNFDENQRPEQQIKDWATPISGELKTVLADFFRTQYDIYL